jgi:hypothetical protein
MTEPVTYYLYSIRTIQLLESTHNIYWDILLRSIWNKDRVYNSKLSMPTWFYSLVGIAILGVVVDVHLYLV